jgi:RNase P protein component
MAREVFRQNAFQYENIDLVVRAYPAARNAIFEDVLRDFDLVLPLRRNEPLFDPE